MSPPLPCLVGARLFGQRQAGLIAVGHASTGHEDRDALTAIAGTSGIVLGERQN